MRLSRTTFALLALLAPPAGASAGPIEFALTAPVVSPGYPPVTTPVLVPGPGGAFTFDTSGAAPVSLAAVNYVPAMLPAPAPRDLHPDGTTHWNQDVYFGVNVVLTDVASGESKALGFTGRAHIYNSYSTGDGWSGYANIWFLDAQQFTLGGNEYTVWGANHYSTFPATLNVWVGDDPPLHLTPEPGAFVLGALALAPLALRRFRRT